MRKGQRRVARDRAAAQSRDDAARFALAPLARVGRDCAEVIASAIRSPRALDGHTPLLFNRAGEANFAAHGGGGGRARAGRVQGGKFLRDVNAPIGRAYTAPSPEFPAPVTTEKNDHAQSD